MTSPPLANRWTTLRFCRRFVICLTRLPPRFHRVTLYPSPLLFYPLHISLPDNLSPHAGTSGSSVRNLNPTSCFSLDVLHFLYHLRRCPETQAQFFCQIQPLCITVFCLWEPLVDSLLVL